VDEIETCKTRIVTTDGSEAVRRMSTSSEANEAEDEFQLAKPPIRSQLLYFR
jgi:hypothetical protein